MRPRRRRLARWRRRVREWTGMRASQRLRRGKGWHGEMGGHCPVQAEGQVDGLEWYFRARGASWSFEVSESFAESDFGKPTYWDASPFYWETGADYGVWPEAGWMPYDEAWRFVVESIAAFRAARCAPSTAPRPSPEPTR